MDNEPATQSTPESFTPLQAVASVAQTDTGWSWGAFFLGPLFLIAIKKYSWLWFYLVAFIPFVGMVFVLGFMIYLGMKGRQLAQVSPMFSNRDEYIGYMKANDHGAKVVAIIYLVFIIVVVGIVSFSVFSSLPEARNWELDARSAEEQQNPGFQQTTGDLESDFGTYEVDDAPFNQTASDLESDFGTLPTDDASAAELVPSGIDGVPPVAPPSGQGMEPGVQ